MKLKSVRIRKVFSIIAVYAVLLIGGVSVSRGEDPAAAALVTKGAKIKVEKDGKISEFYAGPTVIFTADDYQNLGRLHDLQALNLGNKGVPLNDETAAALAHLDKLERFFANGAELSDDGFKVFSGLKNLKRFGLDHWGWKIAGKGNLGPGLAHLAPCTQLESVRLGGCKVDNRVTEAIAQIKSLQSVDLQHTFAVTDDGIPALASLPKLTTIKLSPALSPRITDATLVALGKIPSLEEIDINETWLTYEKGFVHLKDLKSLKKIVLTKVVASDEDIAKLKADHPSAEVQWTKPDDATTEKTKATFQKFWEKQGKKPV